MSEVTLATSAKPVFNIIDAVKKVKVLTEENALLKQENADLKQRCLQLDFKAPLSHERAVNLQLRIHVCALGCYITNINLHLDHPLPGDRLPDYRKIYNRIETALIKDELASHDLYSKQSSESLVTENATIKERMNVLVQQALAVKTKYIESQERMSRLLLPPEGIQHTSNRIKGLLL